MNWNDSPARKPVLMLLWIAYLLVLLEVFAFFVTRYIPKASQFFYSGAHMSESEYVEYLELRDPVLGWPTRNDSFEEDGFEPRVASSSNANCASVYGDSFTYSDEVDAEHSWPAVASDLLGCDVLNFGIGGYGTYQTYLRYRENASHDNAPLVVLNHMSENISRVRNQYRSLLYDGNIRGFKPVAVLDGEQLRHVDQPSFSGYSGYLAAIASPSEATFPHEAYLPSSGFANFPRRFPYSLSLAQALLGHYKIPTMLFNTPHYEFHYRDPKDVEIVRLIMETFVAEAQRHGRTPLVTLVPKCNDYEFLLKEGRFTYAPLADVLRDSGIETFDFGEAIRQRDDFSEAYLKQRDDFQQ